MTSSTHTIETTTEENTMNPDAPTSTPRYLYVAADGTHGDATGIRFIRADSSLLLSLPAVPTQAQMIAYAAEFGETTPTSPGDRYTLPAWTLTAGEIEDVAGRRLTDDAPRYWLQDLEDDVPEHVHVFGDDTVGLVDDVAGGIIAYVHRDNGAAMLAHYLAADAAQ